MWKIESGKDIHRISDEVIEKLPNVEAPGLALARGLHRQMIGSDTMRNAADVMHGSRWLGHPLHPVLTDITLGAWIMGMVFDVLSLLTLRRWRSSRHAADTLTTLGTLTAIPTALSGIADYSAIKKSAARHGTLHGLINTAVLALYLLSVQARRGGNWFSGMLYSSAAFGLVTVSAWLGGELVYNLRVGVNHSQPAQRPQGWMRALPEDDLQDGQPQRVRVDGQEILLYRSSGVVSAIGAVCSHAGGPLEQGRFYEGCVQCPWHDSVFDLQDGSLRHGPSTYNQPVYRVRSMNGYIEVRGTDIEPESRH